eukprot:CAMPEP_0197194440 /NCGR_PEP_ID=MMETSP1423-20130617/29227_1 /TAXON_ID=476441 /ORGANISM="Pseudo-nitzschia heimii, Strain UNC1101" /LENGTH=580 /DNA_ID=CAMNT_0042647863 /DNA_START=207 /DNA_END=1949 /DNA_ORIENTATION=-
MSTYRNLLSNPNAARAASGAIVVITGGTTGILLSGGDFWGAENSETEEPNQQQNTSRPFLGISRGFSSSSEPLPIWSVGHNRITAACERKSDRAFTDPSYPDLSRFGPDSYLRRYLTPEVYAALKDRKTENGVTLEDIIRSGVSLPWGAKPPRGTGVYAGDEASYRVFAELLVPIIEDYHHYHFAEGSNDGNPHLSLATNRKDKKGGSSHDNTLDVASFSAPSHPVSTFVTAMSPAMVLDDNRPMYGRNSKTSGTMLRRTFTNVNRNSVLEQKLDPAGDYILQTRMRVARSIKGFPFSPVISRLQRRALESLFERMVEEDWNNDVDDEIIDNDDDDEFLGKIFNDHGGLRDGTYHRVMDMTNEQHNDLIHRHILFHDPDEYNISAGIGRDWPDARGIYLSSSAASDNGENVPVDINFQQNPDLMIWLNKEDHMRIIATSDGGDLLAVFKRLSRALTQVEQSLHKRGHAFCVHPRYGFVNTSPENLGTALRASVYIKLYRLGQQPGFEDLLDRLHLEASSRFKTKGSCDAQYTGIFDIANSERLGSSEIQLVNTMINGVGRLIELEKRLEKGETVDLEEVR